jgi:hypothetical protein
MFELFKRNNAACSRSLGLLLVLFVFYGTTVEAAHYHGRVTSTASSAGAVVQPDSGSGISTNKPGCNDCLICQLHQNFSATLISFKPIAEQITRVRHSHNSTPLAIRSLDTSPSPGRAPPQAN